MSNQAVDFNNPEAMEAELAAMEAPVETKAKVKKPRKPRVITIEVTEEIALLDVGQTFEYEIPAATRGGGGSGILAGIAVEDMTEEQLKIEYRNANSVHYKQTKAKGVASEAATERLEKVKAIMEAKGIAPTARAAAQVDANTIAALIKAGKVNVDDIQALLDGADQE